MWAYLGEAMSCSEVIHAGDGGECFSWVLVALPQCFGGPSLRHFVVVCALKWMEEVFIHCPNKWIQNYPLCRNQQLEILILYLKTAFGHLHLKCSLLWFHFDSLMHCIVLCFLIPQNCFKEIYLGFISSVILSLCGLSMRKHLFNLIAKVIADATFLCVLLHQDIVSRITFI